MAPKGKKAGAKDKKGDDEQREESLQAVLFADSFETRFNPFTLERPRCLLPLANTPLIEYTLEFLANAGAEEVFLYCGNHTEAVEEYLQNSKWTKSTSPFSLDTIRSDSRSVGDCMRDLESKQLIVGDFICVYGDVVANISIESALAGHRARREKDKKSIMTMVLREAGNTHRTKSHFPRLLYVIDSESGRCVHYEQVRPGQKSTLDIPGDVLAEHTDLEVREDLLDCGIDICTPEVLAQYQDNFDWQLPRNGFLRGVLKDYETFQLTIHTHVDTEGYAARVKNLEAYDAISKDVISRWAYPVVPDTNLVDDQNFQLYKGHVYKEERVLLARMSEVGPRVMLGRMTCVEDQARITNTVIGRNCHIGKRVKIDGAYIWDNVTIEDDTIIEKSIIGDGARIGKRCKIEEGALISYGVRVAEGTIVSGQRRLTTLKRKRGYETDEIVGVSADPKIVGEGGQGYHMELDEEEEEVANTVLVGLQNLDLVVDEISEVDSEDEDEDDEISHARSGSRSDSFVSIDSEESGEDRQKAADFHKEAVNSLFDDMQKGSKADTMSLELKALVLSNNAEDKQIRRALATAFGKRAANVVEQGKSPKEGVAAVLPQYKDLVADYLREEDWQAEFLLFLQTDLVHRSQGDRILLFMSNALATSDMVEAEGVEKWWNDERSTATKELEAVRKDTKQLVDVLCAEEDESSEEEEDESEEEDD